MVDSDVNVWHASLGEAGSLGLSATTGSMAIFSMLALAVCLRRAVR